MADALQFTMEIIISVPDERTRMTAPFAASTQLLVSWRAWLPSAPWTGGYDPSLHQSVNT
jgi:hypothetical protein